MTNRDTDYLVTLAGQSGQVQELLRQSTPQRAVKQALHMHPGAVPLSVGRTWTVVGRCYKCKCWILGDDRYTGDGRTLRCAEC